jgi:CubicO group peptidase (beta-lactamase class C family)
MKKFLLIIFLLPLFCFCQDMPLEKFVDSLVGPMNKPDVPGTMILVAQDGKVLFQKVYGMANVELAVPLKTDHAFAIGSISKQFTAVAVLQLAAQGRLMLTDDIKKYFPDFNTHGYTVTIDNLLSHTSGLTISEKDYDEMHGENKAAISADRFLNYLMQAKPLFVPGTEWSYNNYAYFMLADLVERVSGERFENYMSDHVFKPAGMRQSYIAQDLQTLTNVVSSYTRGYQGRWRNMYRESYFEWAKGSGAVISTLADMLQWDIALRDEKVLPKEWLKKAWTAYTLKNGEQVEYGYAWDVNSFEGLRVISHSGSVYGFATQSVHIPEKNLYVFFADFYFSDPNSIPRKVISKLLGLPRWSAGSKTNISLIDYVGAYQMHHNGTRLLTKDADKAIYLKFTTSNDTLFAQLPLAEKTFLRPAGNDRFIPGRTEESLYIFNRDDKGNVTSVNIIPYLFGGAIARRPNKKVIVEPRPPLKFVTVDSSLLKKYSGSYYRLETDEYFFIQSQGNRLYGYLSTPAQKFELLPVNKLKFSRKGVEDYGVSFSTDSKGLPILIISGFSDRLFKKTDD